MGFLNQIKVKEHDYVKAEKNQVEMVGILKQNYKLNRINR